MSHTLYKASAREHLPRHSPHNSSINNTVDNTFVSLHVEVLTAYFL